MIQRGSVEERKAQTFSYAFTIGQMVTSAYTKAGQIMKKPLNQEEKDQIFNLVDEMRVKFIES